MTLNDASFVLINKEAGHKVKVKVIFISPEGQFVVQHEHRYITTDMKIHNLQRHAVGITGIVAGCLFKSATAMTKESVNLPVLTVDSLHPLRDGSNFNVSVSQHRNRRASVLDVVSTAVECWRLLVVLISPPERTQHRYLITCECDSTRTTTAQHLSGTFNPAIILQKNGLMGHKYAFSRQCSL